MVPIVLLIILFALVGIFIFFTLFEALRLLAVGLLMLCLLVLIGA